MRKFFLLFVMATAMFCSCQPIKTEMLTDDVRDSVVETLREEGYSVLIQD